MKAFLSFLLVLSILSTNAFLLSFYNTRKEQLDKITNSLLGLEERHVRELELKRAIINTIIYSAREMPGSATADEVTAKVAEDLATLEGLEKSYYHIKKLAVSFWCGSPTQQDLKESLRLMQLLNRTVICRNCQKTDEFAIRIENNNQNVVRVCAKFLSADTIQRIVTVSVADPRVVVASFGPDQYSGTPSIGAAIYDTSNNISSVIIIPLSSRIYWDGETYG
jgi:hypothetical protein